LTALLSFTGINALGLHKGSEYNGAGRPYADFIEYREERKKAHLDSRSVPVCFFYRIYIFRGSPQST